MCVAAVGDYYEFLTKMYLDESDVIYLPKGGWPSIINAYPDALTSLGRADKVISLLAHLPYIRNEGWPEDSPHVAADCCFQDWNQIFTGAGPGSNLESCRIVSEGYAFYELASPHVIALTAGHREAFKMVVETELGIVHWSN